MPYTLDFNSGHQLTAVEVNNIKNSGVVQVANDSELANLDIARGLLVIFYPYEVLIIDQLEPVHIL